MYGTDQPTSRNQTLDERGIRAVARTMYRELQSQGYSNSQIIDFSSQMIELVRAQLRAQTRPCPF